MRNARYTLSHPTELDVVATISRRAFQARLAELRMQDDLTLALRDALKIGVSADTLSAETGYSPATVRRLAHRNLTFGEDAAALTGTR